MKFPSLFLGVLLNVCLAATASGQKTDILIVGSDHFAQIYNKNNPNTDVLLPHRQAEIGAFTQCLLKYRPDMIGVELLPEKQAWLDSLYALFVDGKLKLEELEDGRSEVFQIAFRMARQLRVPRVHCVNAPGGTSQSILDNGDNISMYTQEGLALRALVVDRLKALQENRLSFKDYLYFLNQPDTYNRVYRLRYMTPARVTNGTFKNPDAQVDTAFGNPKYIGAELISIYKNRDYKIYSNIVTAQMKTGSRRILVILGAAHIGSLRSIFRDDAEYRLFDSRKYIRK
ncbi:MAG: hypothetical protein EOO08_07770 [Chitinophagaceae bacterium]|nr:MAG: hypothetical protein EOO08_07770 [Chitinophagaceae bacterium]